jgi:hypothetical protein
MPTFRLRKTDGTVETVQAIRLRADDETLHLEKRAAGLWQPALSVPLHEVERIQRRMNEPNGNWAWRNERIPAPTAG